MSGPKEGDNNNDNDDEKRLSDHTAPPCYKKKGKPHRGTVYTDQGKKRTLKSGSVAIMVQSRLRFTQLLQLHGPFLVM